MLICEHFDTSAEQLNAGLDEAARDRAALQNVTDVPLSASNIFISALFCYNIWPRSCFDHGHSDSNHIESIMTQPKQSWTEWFYSSIGADKVKADVEATASNANAVSEVTRKQARDFFQNASGISYQPTVPRDEFTQV